MAIGKGGVNKQPSRADFRDKPTNPYLEELTIRDDLRDFISKRTKEETELLQEDISKYGQKLPAIVALINEELVLIDGHGRYEALKKLNKPRIKVEYRDDLQEDEEIKLYMAKIQLGRRNLSDQVKSRLRGEYWLQVKEGGYGVATRKEVAKELGIAESTLKKDAQYSKDCKIIIDALPEAKVFLEQPTTPKTVVKEIAEVAKTDVTKAKRIIDKLSSEKSKDRKAAKLKEINVKKPDSDSGMSNIKVKTKLANKLKAMAKKRHHTISDILEELLGGN